MAKKGFKTENPNKRMSDRTKEETKVEQNGVAENIESKEDVKPEYPQKKEKKKRGRPTVANKKQQYTLTMNPDLYEVLSELAKANYKSFSQLVTDACVEYMKKMKC